MALDLVLTNPTYNASGKFGQSLNGGYGTAKMLSSTTFTIRAQVKTTAAGAQQCAVGQGGTVFIGINSAGKALGEYGSNAGGGTLVSFASTTSINDGLWHELELNVGPFGGFFFVDGVLVGQSALVGTMDVNSSTAGVGVRVWASGVSTTAYNWAGEVDEVAVYSTQQHSAAYTPRTSAIPNTDANLVALYHLDGNGTNSVGASSAATALSLSGPASGTTGQTSGNFTVSANGSLTGTVVVTPSDGGGGGTFSPTSVSLTSAAPSASFTYTAASAGAKSISITNNGSLTNPAAVTYTASNTVTGSLSLTGATFNASGKFEQSLNGGYGLAAGVLPTDNFTIRAQVKLAAAAAQYCAVGCGGAFFLGVDATGKVLAQYGTANVALTSISSIADNVWHELEFFVSSTGAKLFVDGALVANSTTAVSLNTTTNSVGVRALAYASNQITYNWPGEIDDVAIFNASQHAANYTPSGGRVDNMSANLVAVYHLDGDGANSMGVSAAATALSISGPASGVTGQASGNFTVSANGSITGTVVVTPSAGAGGGTFNPTTVSISSASPTANFTYTAASDGAKSITLTNNGGLANPAAASFTASGSLATALTLTGPASGVRNTASANFTVSANGALSANRVVTPSDGGAGGTFNPATVTLTSSISSANFTYTPSTLGARSISVTNDGALSNPAAVSYTSTIGATNFLNTGNLTFSPFNWKLTANSATSVNPGAYFRGKFTGKSCALTLDMTGINPIPLLEYRIDAGPWTTVPFAATVDLAMQSETLNSWAEHTVEVIFRANDVNSDRWTAKTGALKLTGIYLDAGSALMATPAQPLKGIVFGDSITEACLVMNRTNANAAYWNHARFGYALKLGELLGAEVGVVGFGSTGWDKAAQGVPAFTSSYNLLYAGEARSFAGADFIAINLGTNDGASVQASATAVLNGLVAATPATTKIIIIRPFSGAQAANLQAAVNAANTAAGSARVTYLDTTGFYDSSKTANYPADTIHPNGAEMVTELAPAIANVMRPLLTGSAPAAPTVVSGTSSFTTDAMTSSGTLRANQSCQWTWHAGGSIGGTVGTPVYGSGTLNAGAQLVATGLPNGSGYINVAFADGGRFYQDGVAA